MTTLAFTMFFLSMGNPGFSVSVDAMVSPQMNMEKLAAQNTLRLNAGSKGDSAAEMKKEQHRKRLRKGQIEKAKASAEAKKNQNKNQVKA
ncbi:hypothetical protein KKF84_12120, partial [Myxococcota bacterium]|nr:hypothetical protein [Myxococcota bacterium]